MTHGTTPDNDTSHLTMDELQPPCQSGCRGDQGGKSVRRRFHPFRRQPPGQCVGVFSHQNNEGNYLKRGWVDGNEEHVTLVMFDARFI